MKRYKLKKDTPAFKAGTECYIEEAGHMVPCRGISYTIVHRDQLEKNPNILTEWFEEIDETTRWKPEKFQKYYYVEDNSFVYDDAWSNVSSIDDGRFDIGNCFETKEEAEQVVEYLKALAVVRGDATAKFVEDDNNWAVYYHVGDNSLHLDHWSYHIRNGIFGLPYFATKEDAQRSIVLHEKEWLTIFGIEEEE